MTTGQRIKEARKKAGLTQKELGEKLGVAYQTLAQWENDLRNPKYDTIKRIAAALGVEWTELVPEDKQGATIVEYVIENAGLTVIDKVGNVIRQGDGRKWREMTDAEKYRAGFLQFHSEEDRIAHFYRTLNEDGKLAAGVCFFKHLDKATLVEVANYVMVLSENPLYQRLVAPHPPAPPSDGAALKEE